MFISLYTISANAKFLKSISLQFCYEISDNGFITLLKGCHLLSKFNLQGLNKLTVASFCSLSDCKKLESIKISGSLKIIIVYQI